MAPSKKTTTTAKAANKTVKATKPDGSKKHKKRRTETFAIYIYKVLKQVH
jgi:hypothetical protein